MRYTIEGKYALLTLILLCFIFLLDQTHTLETPTQQLNIVLNRLSTWGFGGMFFISFLGSCAILIQVPYTLPILSAALQDTPLSDMLLLGLGAGVGSSLGKLLCYQLVDDFFAAHPGLSQNRLSFWVRQQAESQSHYLPLFIFFIAATPLPDDAAIIPLASLRYGVQKLWLPLVSGKILHNLGVVLFFHTSATLASRLVPQEISAAVGFAILMFFLMLILYQLEKRAHPQPLPMG